MPRLERFGEHINDHQLDIAQAMQARNRAVIIHDAHEVAAAVERARELARIVPRLKRSDTLTVAVKEEIQRLRSATGRGESLRARTVWAISGLIGSTGSASKSSVNPSPRQRTLGTGDESSNRLIVAPGADLFSGSFPKASQQRGISSPCSEDARQLLDVACLEGSAVVLRNEVACCSNGLGRCDREPSSHGLVDDQSPSLLFRRQHEGIGHAEYRRQLRLIPESEEDNGRRQPSLFDHRLELVRELGHRRL